MAESFFVAVTKVICVCPVAMKAFPDMEQMARILHGLVYGFEYHMVYYFTPIIVLSLLSVMGAVSWLARSKKPILIGSAAIALLWASFAVCMWSNVEWKLYCYEVYGHFHVPAHQDFAHR